ncbi:hypothetical protein [Streptomyces sp. cmx-10-25]|uniref:hypothetical protein n=1 Tax=Streptomyces sp. cmx-10-25 TaxID=2790919 RepID=UPI003981168C
MTILTIDGVNGLDDEEDPVIPLVINGVNGLDDETDANAVLGADLRYAAQHPDHVGISPHTPSTLELRFVLGIYNRLRPLLIAEQTARHNRDRTRHLVEVRWEALSNATAWHAAHHAYIVAVNAAHTAIDSWAQAARAAVGFGWFPVKRMEEVYQKRIVGAGHPPIERLDPDVGPEADRLHEELTRIDEYRRALAAQTLGTAPAAVP